MKKLIVLYNISILVLNSLSCTNLGTHDGSLNQNIHPYAEADILQEALVDVIDEKMSFDCIKNLDQVYGLLRALRPELERRSQDFTALDSVKHSLDKKTCLSDCSCQAVIDLHELSKTNFQELIELENKNQCRILWKKNLCSQKLFKEIIKEVPNFTPPDEKAL